MTIGNSVTSIGNYAFYNCEGITSIDIVDNINNIGEYAFYGCANLETLYISNSIESIGNNAFGDCNNILDIKIGSKKAISVSENIFSSDAYTNACLYVPTGRKFAYEKANTWKNFYIVEMDFTDIDNIETDGTVGSDAIYNLNGQRVENPTKGIYIVNGKKVVF